MEVVTLKLNDAFYIEPKVHGDHRGFFMETWRDSWFEDLSLNYRFVQDNHSKSVRGSLRGLHYQISHPQGKLVRVTSGEVFDVVVDLRVDSPTFSQWEGIYLSAENKRIMWVPPGFAHGFYVVSDEAEFVYKCSEYFSPEDDRTLLWNDPDIGIEWPVEDFDNVILSAKDKAGTPLKKADVYRAMG
ncbi:MAG: dTDP-4-dehydrorhamnose 3,5-epimerase [Pseudomonadales bacterium]|mgnify:CR=1 FL=1|nr:dTDP-4-dehydrorhamnose 3,5-epimerase [Pseudomonadales bacterium]MAR90857.1 dTDP-4-dehydrorhamnose 3,5-epimerase [Pseudomonadales bacterium]